MRHQKPDEVPTHVLKDSLRKTMRLLGWDAPSTKIRETMYDNDLRSLLGDADLRPSPSSKQSADIILGPTASETAWWHRVQLLYNEQKKQGLFQPAKWGTWTMTPLGINEADYSLRQARLRLLLVIRAFITRDSNKPRKIRRVPIRTRLANLAQVSHKESLRCQLMNERGVLRRGPRAGKGVTQFPIHMTFSMDVALKVRLDKLAEKVRIARGTLMRDAVDAYLTSCETESLSDIPTKLVVKKGKSHAQDD